MTLICYKERKFSSSSLEIITKANEIIADYHEQGFDLTLRQLYYQFVARDLIKNNQKEYDRIGSIINDARLAGLVSWDAITDRTRNLDKYPAWDSPASIMQACIEAYQEDIWANQSYYVEVWVEKEALISVVKAGCDGYRVPHFACRGYVSQSEMWAAAERFIDKGKEGLILHFGDHDPSGIDMTRDIKDRMELFGAEVEVKRIALNFNQIEDYSPPPNPAKMTDSRFVGYREKYGEESWELDALNPETIVGMIRSHIANYIDETEWEDAVEAEAKSKAKLEKALKGIK